MPDTMSDTTPDEDINKILHSLQLQELIPIFQSKSKYSMMYAHTITHFDNMFWHVKCTFLHYTFSIEFYC